MEKILINIELLSRNFSGSRLVGRDRQPVPTFPDCALVTVKLILAPHNGQTMSMSGTLIDSTSISSGRPIRQ
jgi:hypothetical protein